jgi:hypothetical protein
MALPLSELTILTANARKLAESLRTDGLSDTMVISSALSKVHGKILELLLANLRNAISDTVEYDTPLLRGHLLSVFDNPDMIHATPEGDVDILSQAYVIAGDFSDFQEGIDAARAQLGVTGEQDIAQRAAFWENFIYGPARENRAAPKSVKKGQKAAVRAAGKGMYQETIDARVGEWDDMAPFWIWMEEGNTGPWVYPVIHATNFVEKTEDQGQILLDQAIIEKEEEMQSVLEQELRAFASNTGAIRRSNAGRILSEVLVDGQPFEIYVTPTKRIGVRRAR